MAFEMARQLEQEGQAVALLALFDTHARLSYSRGPSFRSLVSRAPIHVRTLFQGRHRLAYVGQRVRTPRKLVEAPFWRVLVLWHRRGGWLPRALQNVAQALKNARRDYVPKAYGGRVTLFRPTQSRVPLLEWEALATGGLEIHEVPGDHLSMVLEPHVRTLAEKLARCLDKAGARVSTDRPTGTGRGGDRAA